MKKSKIKQIKNVFLKIEKQMLRQLDTGSGFIGMGTVSGEQ